MERLLDASGPVPWRLKRSLFETLVDDPLWQVPIPRALLYAAHDYYGQIDWPEAIALFGILNLPEDTPGLAEMRRAIANH